MADMIWKGYRNGKGCLKIGDEFILPGGKLSQDHLNKLDPETKDSLEIEGYLVEAKEVVSKVEPIKAPSTEKGKTTKPKGKSKKEESKK